MANSVIPTAYFEARLKKFLKKFPSLEFELRELEKILIAWPETGTNLGSGIFKVRVASESKGKGKSGGFRVITYLVRPRSAGVDIYLITIFDKSEESTISKPELKKLVQRLFNI